GCIAFKQLDTNSRYCIDPTLSVSVIPDNSYSLNLFPNPINTGDLTIAYQLTQDSYIEFRILDCTGRVIMKLDDEHKTAGDYSQKVNISNLAGGVYLFTANINGQCQTIEFIKI
ncbi:MAG TPA: T9SS type A sorting domain-containing protein, partial [Bacteroidia bacterium]|nr:T9SS type A sorting domain-containing protein [Bacteroidia bacterium]